MALLGFATLTVTALAGSGMPGLGDGADHLAITTAVFAAATVIWLWRAARVSRTA